MLDRILPTLLRDLSIDPDLTIQLAGYEELSAPEAVVERLQMSDQSLQEKFLADRLQEYFLDVFFRQVQRPVMSVPEKPIVQAKVFANDNMGSLDSEFYTNLTAANSSRGYYDDGWEVEGFADDGWVLVVKNHLHLQTPPTHINPRAAKLAVGDQAAIVMPKNVLTVDRYVAISNRGRLRQAPLVNCYFNCPAATAIELMSRLCQVLNQAELVFEIEAELNEKHYRRIDSLVLRLEQSSFGQAQPLLQEIYGAVAGQLRSAVPLLTRAVAKGLGIAEVDSLTLDFGSYCWGVVARGVAKAWQIELTDGMAQLEIVRSELALASIDLVHPYSLTHENIYESWE
jgi:HopA1 effector protein family